MVIILNLFMSFHFQIWSYLCCVGEKGGVARRGRGVGKVSHIGAWIILSAAFACLWHCSVSCSSLKVKVFTVSVHGVDFSRSKCRYFILEYIYLYWMSNWETLHWIKNLTKNYLFCRVEGSGDMRRVVLREKRAVCGDRYVTRMHFMCFWKNPVCML